MASGITALQAGFIFVGSGAYYITIVAISCPGLKMYEKAILAGWRLIPRGIEQHDIRLRKLARYRLNGSRHAVVWVKTTNHHEADIGKMATKARVGVGKGSLNVKHIHAFQQDGASLLKQGLICLPRWVIYPKLKVRDNW